MTKLLLVLMLLLLMMMIMALALFHTEGCISVSLTGFHETQYEVQDFLSALPL
jgi:hypothetical protein